MDSLYNYIKNSKIITSIDIKKNEEIKNIAENVIKTLDANLDSKKEGCLSDFEKLLSKTVIKKEKEHSIS